MDTAGKFIVDFMIGVDGANQKHMLALADSVVSLLKSRGIRVRGRPVNAVGSSIGMAMWQLIGPKAPHVEGRDSNDWMLERQ